MFLWLSGCTDGSASLDDPIEFFQTFSEQFCALVEECGAQPGWEYDSCRLKLDPSEESIESFPELMERGVARYDSERAAMCLESLTTHECPVVIEEQRDSIMGFWHNVANCDGVVEYVNGADQ